MTKLRQLLLAGLIAPALMLFGTAAMAATIPWTSDLALQDDADVAPDSTASGAAFGTVDTDTRQLTWNISWSGLSSQVLGIHFHEDFALGPVRHTVGCQYPIGPCTEDIPTLGSLANPNIGATIVGEGVVAQLLAGNLFINVHTADNPGGEIDGRVVPAAVPEPAAIAMLGIGLLALALTRKRLI